MWYATNRFKSNKYAGPTLNSYHCSSPNLPLLLKNLDYKPQSVNENFFSYM